MRLNFLLAIFLCMVNFLQAQTGLQVVQDSNLVVYWNQDTILQYYAATKYPPEGSDTNYKRSAFIHPLKTVGGEILTAIQPSDHLHHYGMWNPWTHTLFKSDTVDFWNLAKKEGTVRFIRFKQIDQQSRLVRFTALLEHLRFMHGQELPILHEEQTITVYTPDQNGTFLFDLESVQECVADAPLLLLTYRYGGLGWRTNQFWNPRNSSVLTSELKTRTNADDTRARWIFAEGFFPSGNKGGMLIMDHPDNFNSPQPVRVWTDAPTDNPQLLLNYAPTKNVDWLLESGKPVKLQYRMLVYDGEISAPIADQYWNSFSIKKENN